VNLNIEIDGRECSRSESVEQLAAAGATVSALGHQIFAASLKLKADI